MTRLHIATLIYCTSIYDRCRCPCLSSSLFTINISHCSLYTNIHVVCRECSTTRIEVANADTVYTVHKFVADALKVITAIRTRGKVPIIVGGTNYYIEALIFEDSLLSATTAEGSESAAVDSDRNDHRTSSAKRCGTAQHVEQESITGTLYSKLKQIDPDMAERLHPNDSRKISRSLDVFHTTGKPHSKWLAEQPRETSLRSVVGKKVLFTMEPCGRILSSAMLHGLHTRSRILLRYGCLIWLLKVRKSRARRGFVVLLSLRRQGAKALTQGINMRCESADCMHLDQVRSSRARCASRRACRHDAGARFIARASQVVRLLQKALLCDCVKIITGMKRFTRFAVLHAFLRTCALLKGTSLYGFSF